MAEQDCVAVTDPVMEGNLSFSGVRGEIRGDIADSQSHWTVSCVGSHEDTMSHRIQPQVNCSIRPIDSRERVPVSAGGICQARQIISFDHLIERSEKPARRFWLFRDTHGCLRRNGADE